MEGKKVEFSKTELVHVVKPGDLNGGEDCLAVRC